MMPIIAYEPVLAMAAAAMPPGGFPECDDCQLARTKACAKCVEGDLYEPSIGGQAKVLALLTQIKVGAK